MRIVVVAPHPDDETLGCGGVLLRHKAAGDELHWLIVTGMTKEGGFAADRIAARERELQKVSEFYGFKARHNLMLPTTQLDALPLSRLVDGISKVFKLIEPEVVFTPYADDAHSDHRAVFDAVTACTKWFRYPSVRKILAYETLSETDFSLSPSDPGFRPNVFADISSHLNGKVAAAKMYAGELAEFPFPRSEKAIRALAQVRGAAAGYEAAEAFMLLRERL